MSTIFPEPFFDSLLEREVSTIFSGAMFDMFFVDVATFLDF